LRNVLTGAPRRDDVHRLHRRPVHSGDIPEVGDPGEALGEDPGGGRVELGDPRRVRVEDLMHGKIETAIA